MDEFVEKDAVEAVVVGDEEFHDWPTKHAKHTKGNNRKARRHSDRGHCGNSRQSADSSKNLMLRFVAVTFLTALVASANPISGYLTVPPHTMIAENVVVGVSEKGAIVTGRYRFHVTPDAPTYWARPPYLLVIQLPVPVPASLKGFENINSEVRPFVTLKGTRYYPEKEMHYYPEPSLPKEVKLSLFVFQIDRKDLDEEFDLSIQYEQPVIAVDGKELVYYVPFLPNYARYEKELMLHRSNYLITYEGYGDTVLRLLRPTDGIVRSEPKLISINPEHRKVVAVERLSRSKDDSR